MDLTMREDFSGYGISLTEAKRILNRDGNKYSDEDVKKILDYLRALAELTIAHHRMRDAGDGELIDLE